LKRSIAIHNAARLSIERRQLLIQNEQGEHRVPLEDLAVIVLDHQAIDVTGPLLGECGDYGIAVVCCNPKHLPSSYLLPYPGNELHAQTLRGQIDASQPAKKRLWQTIIQEKVRSQGRLLQEKTGSDAGLGMLAHQVRSGDATYCEGRAADTYFSALFSPAFTRLRGKEVEECVESVGLRVVNSMLNYGYMALRAAVARAVVGAGLHPALGIHHRHRNNAFALADDLVEPLRVLVDREVYERTFDALPEELNPELKRSVLRCLTAEVQWESRKFPLDVALENYAAGVRRCLLGESKVLEVPGA
jgi:CRISP-associated protein Cas1